VRQTSQKRYKYVGKERDEETGLYYYGFRYYAAWLCRFVSVDPMKEERIWLNPYNYVQNNPINRVDPTGMVDEEPPEGATSVERNSDGTIKNINIEEVVCVGKKPIEDNKDWNKIKNINGAQIFNGIQIYDEARVYKNIPRAELAYAANGFDIESYYFVPHYSKTEKGNSILSFYTANYIADDANDIHFIVGPYQLGIFKQNIRSYTAGANLYYSNGVPSEGIIRMAAGETWKGLGMQWDDKYQTITNDPLSFIVTSLEMIAGSPKIVTGKTIKTSFKGYNKFNMSNKYPNGWFAGKGRGAASIQKGIDYKKSVKLQNSKVRLNADRINNNIGLIKTISESVVE